jgi:hypothetical protein
MSYKEILPTEQIDIECYKELDTLSLKYAPHLGVPTEIRAFGAEVTADVMCLSDKQVYEAASELDELDNSNQEVSREIQASNRLLEIYGNNLANPPRAYEGDAKTIETFAMNQLRVALVSRLFRIEYPERFPERVDEDYKFSEPFSQGNVLAYRIAQEYLAHQANL